MAPNKNYRNPHEGEKRGAPGKLEGIQRSKGDKSDPKFTAAPDNSKKKDFGYGNSAKNGGKGASR